jgi:hypothetical protein
MECAFGNSGRSQNCLLKLVADQIKRRLRKGTAQFQRMETRKRSVWYQRGCNIGIFPQPPEKMCQLVDVDEVFMLKTTLKVHNNLDISKYGKIKAYLKSQSRTYKSKKAKVLEKEHIEEFLLNASNSEHLMTKVIKF